MPSEFLLEIFLFFKQLLLQHDGIPVGNPVHYVLHKDTEPFTLQGKFCEIYCPTDATGWPRALRSDYACQILLLPVIASEFIIVIFM